MKKIDPFYWYLMAIHRCLLKAKLKMDERAFVDSNINKHRLAQWINLLAIPSIFLSLKAVASDQMSTVIMALLAPVMVMGAAWFGISFGAIPARFIHFSMEITFWMYAAFKLSLTTMFLAIGFVSPWMLWPVLVFIYLAVDFSCTQYDTADGLKAGLDEAVLKHSRAAVLFYGEQGIKIEEE